MRRKILVPLLRTLHLLGPNELSEASMRRCETRMRVSTVDVSVKALSRARFEALNDTSFFVRYFFF